MMEGTSEKVPHGRVLDTKIGILKEERFLVGSIARIMNWEIIRYGLGSK
jgi:hypothetical protein